MHVIVLSWIVKWYDGASASILNWREKCLLPKQLQREEKRLERIDGALKKNGLINKDNSFSMRLLRFVISNRHFCFHFEKNRCNIAWHTTHPVYCIYSFTWKNSSSVPRIICYDSSAITTDFFLLRIAILYQWKEFSRCMYEYCRQIRSKIHFKLVCVCLRANKNPRIG